jgi:hypothetical protein
VYYARSIRPVGYEWTSWALRALQDIEPHEVSQVLAAERRWPRRAKSPEGLVVLTVWGRTDAGRPLIVAVRRADEWTWQVVGARAMRPDEQRELQSWEGTADE